MSNATALHMSKEKEAPSSGVVRLEYASPRAKHWTWDQWLVAGLAIALPLAVLVGVFYWLWLSFLTPRDS
jgi:hypothetical protein